MMKSGGTSPTLDDPPLPEFSGATLHLQQKDGGGTGRTSGQPNANKLVVRESSQEIFVDLVDLSLTKSGNDQAAEAEAPIRKRRNTSPDSNESLYAASPLADGLARGYFSSRESLLERALHDCKKILVHDDNGPLLGSWLLTQVDHWDNEKERLVLLCGRALFIVKYDFIALNLLDYMRLNLNKVSTLTIGRLCYPTRSITPKVQLVANRVTNIFKGCLQQLGQEAGRGGGLLNLSSTWRTGVQADQPQANADGTGQQDREGVRLTWRATIEPRLAQLWNPWSKEIPWLTFVSHPLLCCRADQHDPQFDVHDFITNIRDALQSATPTMETPPTTPQFSSASASSNEGCLVEYSPIVMESYIGLPALVHNTGQLGFYKIRGKISF